MIIGSTTIARCLHINILIPDPKERLDQKDICIRAAEFLSFFKCEEQKIIEELLADGRKINMKQAKMIKKQSKESKLTKESIDKIFKPKSIRTQVKPVKLSSQLLSKYFKTEQIAGEIEKIICAALNMYFLSSDKKP